ncbi:MAG: DMT family transporter [Promethearchaeota archaeon]
MFGELIAILACLTFVTSNVLFRKTEHEATPAFINVVRTAIGTLTFIIIALAFGIFFEIFSLPWGLWIILIVSFIFGQVVGDTSYFSAQKDLGVTITLALAMTFPLFTFILSIVFLKSPFDYRFIISTILVGIGVIIIGKCKIPMENVNSLNRKQEKINNTNKNLNPKSLIMFKAIILALIASLGWAIGAVLIDFATNEIDQILDTETLSSILGNVIRFPFALLILLSFVWREKYLYSKSNFMPKKKRSSHTWFWLILASIIGTSLGAYLYTEAIRLAGASLMSLIATATPLFSLPLTYFINHEKISRLGFLGVVITILGVTLILI